MKTALIHDYFNQIGGAERVFLRFNEIFKDADLYAPLVNTGIVQKLNLKRMKSLIKNIPFDHRYILPFFPLLLPFFRLNGYDLILSSSSAWTKNIKKPKGTLHICYCHTPMRYAWDLREFYLQNETFLMRPFARVITKYFRWWDYRNTKNVDAFIANSKNVQDRIKRYYGRDSTVIYPPVDTSFYKPSNDDADDFYLVVSRLIKFKRVDLAIEACKKLKRKLIVIGSGREYNQLKKIENETIKVLGFVPEKDLLRYYQRCRALLFCNEEDFGLTPVEAQACGQPVIAYGKGGALESVIEGKTGHFFYEQTPEALAKAILEFEKMHFDPKDCRENSLKFDVNIFKKKILSFVEKEYEAFKQKR